MTEGIVAIVDAVQPRAGDRWALHTVVYDGQPVFDTFILDRTV